MNKYLILIISILLAKCASKEENNYTYFGGKIINPKSDYVLLLKEHKVIDSIPLTKENTFMSKLKNISPGLYFFKHGLEHQYVYLEPKDSLLVRLNTWGFDESLVFSGTNAYKNNTLIDAFLQNEKDDIAFLNYYKLNATDFKTKIDSIKNVKAKIIEEFQLNNEVSDEFIDILNITLKYPVYTKYENFIRENSIKKSPESIDPSFLSHREEANINIAPLMCYIPYRNYVYANLYGDVYKQNLNKNTDEFTIALLKNIHKKITTDKQRNRLLRHITIRNFYNKSSGEINNEPFNTYFALSTNKKDKKLISELINDAKKVKQNDKLPPFSLLKSDGKQINIKQVTQNKKTVIYFKGKTKSSDEWLASRVKYLMNNNKDTEFIIVNVNKKRDHFINTLDTKYQYALNENSEAYLFLNSSFPRVILVNEKGVIENSFAALSSDKIEKQIADL